MSRNAVRAVIRSDVQHMSHGCFVRKDETLPATHELQHEVRSRAPHKHAQRRLRYMPSTLAPRRGDIDSRTLECAHNMFPLSYTTGEVGRSRYFFMRSMPSAWTPFSHACHRRSVQSRF